LWPEPGRVVVRGHIHRLHRGDRALLGGCDALLKLAHLFREVWLVAHRGRHAAEQRGNFGASLSEPEDIVNEEQHVAALDIAEVFGNGETGECYAQA